RPAPACMPNRYPVRIRAVAAMLVSVSANIRTGCRIVRLQQTYWLVLGGTHVDSESCAAVRPAHCVQPIAPVAARSRNAGGRSGRGPAVRWSLRADPAVISGAGQRHGVLRGARW